MQPAIRSSIPVRVKNSYNPSAKGTLITRTRDKSESLVTAITSKNSVQLIDIVSTRMLGQYGFLSQVNPINDLAFKIFISLLRFSLLLNYANYQWMLLRHQTFLYH